MRDLLDPREKIDRLTGRRGRENPILAGVAVFILAGTGLFVAMCILSM